MPETSGPAVSVSVPESQDSPPTEADSLWWAQECDHVESELDVWLDSLHPDELFEAADFVNDRGGWGGHEAEQP